MYNDDTELLFPSRVIESLSGLRGEEWEALVAKSKFAPYPQYGRALSGRIGIQDHGHELRYRNIKIRPF